MRGASSSEERERIYAFYQVILHRTRSGGKNLENSSERATSACGTSDGIAPRLNFAASKAVKRICIK